MKQLKSILVPLSLFMLLPFGCLGAVMYEILIQTRAEIISFFNLALLATSIISIKQFFWPGDNNTMPFHVFNIIFALVFYAVSLPFLIANREYYEVYNGLAPISVLGKFFLSINLSSFAQWLIVAAVFINVLYIKKYRHDYYQAGLAEDGIEERQASAPGLHVIEEMQSTAPDRETPFHPVFEKGHGPDSNLDEEGDEPGEVYAVNDERDDRMMEGKR